MKTTHYIDELIFDVSFTSKALARREKTELNTWIANELLPAIDDLFSQYASGDSVLQLEKLELDIGSVSSRNYQRDIATRVNQQLEDAIKAHCLHIPAPGKQTTLSSELALLHKPTDDQLTTLETETASFNIKESAEASIEQLIVFLRTGQLPWHRAHNPKRKYQQHELSHEQLLQTLLQDGNLANILQKIPEQEQLAQRLASQFSEQQRVALLHQLAPAYSTQVLTLLDILLLNDKITKSISSNGTDSLSKLWTDIFTVFLQKKYQEEKDWLIALLARLSSRTNIGAESILQIINIQVHDWKNIKDSRGNIVRKIEVLISKLGVTGTHTPEPNTADKKDIFDQPILASNTFLDEIAEDSSLSPFRDSEPTVSTDIIENSAGDPATHHLAENNHYRPYSKEAVQQLVDDIKSGKINLSATSATSEYLKYLIQLIAEHTNLLPDNFNDVVLKSLLHSRATEPVKKLYLKSILDSVIKPGASDLQNKLTDESQNTFPEQIDDTNSSTGHSQISSSKDQSIYFDAATSSIDNLSKSNTASPWFDERHLRDIVARAFIEGNAENISSVWTLLKTHHKDLWHESALHFLAQPEIRQQTMARFPLEILINLLQHIQPALAGWLSNTWNNPESLLKISSFTHEQPEVLKRTLWEKSLSLSFGANYQSLTPEVFVNYIATQYTSGDASVPSDDLRRLLLSVTLNPGTDKYSSEKMTENLNNISDLENSIHNQYNFSNNIEHLAQYLEMYIKRNSSSETHKNLKNFFDPESSFEKEIKRLTRSHPEQLNKLYIQTSVEKLKEWSQYLTLNDWLALTESFIKTSDKVDNSSRDIILDALSNTWLADKSVDNFYDYFITLIFQEHISADVISRIWSLPKENHQVDKHIQLSYDLTQNEYFKNNPQKTENFQDILNNNYNISLSKVAERKDSAQETYNSNAFIHETSGREQHAIATTTNGENNINSGSDDLEYDGLKYIDSIIQQLKSGKIRSNNLILNIATLEQLINTFVKKNSSYATEFHNDLLSSITKYSDLAQDKFIYYQQVLDILVKGDLLDLEKLVENKPLDIEQTTTASTKEPFSIREESSETLPVPQESFKNSFGTEQLPTSPDDYFFNLYTKLKSKTVDISGISLQEQEWPNLLAFIVEKEKYHLKNSNNFPRDKIGHSDKKATNKPADYQKIISLILDGSPDAAKYAETLLVNLNSKTLKLKTTENAAPSNSVQEDYKSDNFLHDSLPPAPLPNRTLSADSISTNAFSQKGLSQDHVLPDHRLTDHHIIGHRLSDQLLSDNLLTDDISLTTDDQIELLVLIRETHSNIISANNDNLSTIDAQKLVRIYVTASTLYDSQKRIELLNLIENPDMQQTIKSDYYHFLLQKILHGSFSSFKEVINLIESTIISTGSQFSLEEIRQENYLTLIEKTKSGKLPLNELLSKIDNADQFIKKYVDTTPSFRDGAFINLIPAIQYFHSEITDKQIIGYLIEGNILELKNIITRYEDSTKNRISIGDDTIVKTHGFVNDQDTLDQEASASKNLLIHKNSFTNASTSATERVKTSENISLNSPNDVLHCINKLISGDLSLAQLNVSVVELERLIVTFVTTLSTYEPEYQEDVLLAIKSSGKNSSNLHSFYYAVLSKLINREILDLTHIFESTDNQQPFAALENRLQDGNIIEHIKPDHVPNSKDNSVLPSEKVIDTNSNSVYANNIVREFIKAIQSKSKDVIRINSASTNELAEICAYIKNEALSESRLPLSNIDTQQLVTFIIDQTSGITTENREHLNDAIKKYSGQAKNPSAYYLKVIQALLKEENLDFEVFIDATIAGDNIRESTTTKREHPGENEAENGTITRQLAEEQHAPQALEWRQKYLLELLQQDNLDSIETIQLQKLIELFVARSHKANVNQWFLLANIQRVIDRLITYLPAVMLHKILMLLHPQRYEEIQALIKIVTDALALLLPIDKPVGNVTPDNRGIAIRKAKWHFIFEYLFIPGSKTKLQDIALELTYRLAKAANLPESQRLSNLVQRRIALLTTKADSKQKPQLHSSKTDEEILTPMLQTGIHIHNAGQIIVATYLPRLFAMLNLTVEGKFVSHAAAERAVHLLQFIVTGQKQTPEYDLTLNKVLCGMSTSIPISAEIEVTTEEQTIIEQMLTSIIQHWSVLGSTSIAGLRETFLQRQGWLTLEDDGWRLKVQQATFDMLLDRIPWNISIVKHGWMDKPLRISWRT